MSRVVTAAVRTPHLVVAMPSRVRGNHFATAWAASLLPLPEGEHASLSTEGRGHLAIQTLFEVGLPAEVVGIRPARNFGMACDRETVGREEMHRLALSCRTAHLTGEHPVSRAEGHKVAGFHPSPALVGMATFGPAPQRLEDRMIHRLEDFGADPMPVIQRPAPDERVQVANEGTRWRTLVGFDDPSDFPQHRFDALRRRLDEQLAVVFANVLSEEVKPFLDMRDHGLLGREVQATLLQERLNKGFHFIFQELLESRR